MADSKERLHKLRMIAADNAALNDLWSTRAKDPASRCHEMIETMQGCLRFLGGAAGGGGREGEKARKFVERMWQAFVNIPHGEYGPITVIERAISIASETYDGKHMDAAMSGFQLWLAINLPENMRDLTPANVALAKEAIRVWGRKPGRRTTADRSAPKWEAFAALVEGMGYGEFDAVALKEEVLRQRRKRADTKKGGK
jgi:hypothetical protein